MPYVKAGALRSRVDIVAPAGTQSGTGGTVPSGPVTVASRIPAEITSGPLGEALQVGAIQSGIASVVRIRYRPGIEAYMTVVLEGRTLQIASVVDVDNRHATLELTCVEAQ
jgi:SPP1 family predicted phage head-tail adaptor